jgi:hypothetical protein
MTHLQRRSRGGQGMLLVEPKELTSEIRGRVAAHRQDKDSVSPPHAVSPPSSLPGLDKLQLCMPVLGVRQSKVTHPTGDPKFAVLQAFPAGFSAEEADPFLMCDEFGPMTSTGTVQVGCLICPVFPWLLLDGTRSLLLTVG